MVLWLCFHTVYLLEIHIAIFIETVMSGIFLNIIHNGGGHMKGLICDKARWWIVWVQFIFFWQYWGLNSAYCLVGSCSTTWATLPALFCVCVWWVFSRWDLKNYLLLLILNLSLPDLCCLSSYLGVR
jgi:hypothetical protein